MPGDVRILRIIIRILRMLSIRDSDSAGTDAHRARILKQNLQRKLTDARILGPQNLTEPRS
jgi:hypothetical protein